ncbi:MULTISPECIES: F0F1 ATP synthase subunit delta [Aneurinibacillus]|jgi:F-type H+-transporting ATPase subunit delta|uniref:ATP synthase subunit delta n=1 Tax=Aneurinibacillus danicus TaxID=267746 RepID=A0A511V8B9_9BACL|nr:MULTISPECIES: F0F1 ATP synthase subunit delta [Aneurinibacillus]GEN34441.1 F0F1 ATP synthase subunit delta [Aneurinibacillus danicus]
MSAVAKRYARALYEVASEQQAIDTTETELTQITDIIKQSDELKMLLTHPKVTAQEKKEMVNDLFAGKVSETTLNFLNLLLERGREDELNDIAKHFVNLSNEERGYADATVITAKPLTEAEVQKVAEQFGQKVNKKLRVKAKVDPSIIGGIIVRIGDRLYDGSIKGKLARFTQQIKQAQV